MSEEIAVEIGSDNVYADLGYDQPEEMQAKAEMVHQIALIIENRWLTQERAAEIMGIDQPKVSALLRGRFRGFSIDRILRLLIALDNDVSIVIQPKREERGHLSVVGR